MFEQLRQAFGDPSREQLVALAKATLRNPNAPLQEQAAAIERLSSERDEESKALVLAYAASSGNHDWLQQVAGEAVAQMLETGALRIEEIRSLSAVASETAQSMLRGVEDQDVQSLLKLVAAVPRT